MHWYRPKVQPGLTTTTQYSKVNSQFTYCNKLIGHRGIADSSCLCCRCYERIRTPLIRAQFESVETHFISIGLEYLPKTCIHCEIQIVKQQPISRCVQCTNKLLEFKFHSEEFTLEDQRDSEILLIRGRYF